ncbi:MAG: DUF1844 domain-containing protein [Acidobacteriota bacterium]|nr:DUF1844 domain-containing protein [Acidobacteriota bacterium]
MSEEQGNFKVTDRRLFNPDGSPRDVPESEKGVREQPPVAAPEITSPQPIAAAEATAETSLPPKPAGREEPDVAGSEAELPGAEDPASFASFMMSIASNAASSLGMMEHPVTGKREVDLDLGKHWIDILTMLRQKTRGNLLPQEQQVLESLLADLQMQFVSLSNAAPKVSKAYTGRDITGG